MKPAEFWIREDVYYTYVCKNCEQETGETNIVKAVKDPALLPGSFASAEAVALATQKFVGGGHHVDAVGLAFGTLLVHELVDLADNLSGGHGSPRLVLVRKLLPLL